MPGDQTGLTLPAHPDALIAGGAAYLTQAFRATGVLTSDNRVAKVVQAVDCPGGSTGRKLLLTVDYARPDATLHRQLFVKFSRDFDDPIRDRARGELASEVRLALLSRHPNFPVTVPRCYFADVHAESGTGVLVTQCVPFGCDRIEPLYPKALDYRLPEPLTHYRAVIRALARLTAR